MRELPLKKHKIWLSITDTALESIPTSTALPCSLTTAIKNILQSYAIPNNT